MNSVLQRESNLRKANVIRMARAQSKREIKAGELTVTEALDLSCWASAAIATLLTAQRKWGRQKVHSFLKELERRWQVALAPTRRICELSERQKAAVRAALGEMR